MTRCFVSPELSSIMVLRDKPEGAKRYQGVLIPLEKLSQWSSLQVTLLTASLFGWSRWRGTYSVPAVARSDAGQPVYYPETFRTYMTASS